MWMDCVVIRIRYKDFSAGTHDMAGMYGMAEGCPRGVTVYLLPGLAAFQPGVGPKEQAMIKDVLDTFKATAVGNVVTVSSTISKELFEKNDIPYAPMHSLESLYHDPHLAQTQFFREVEHPSEGAITEMAVPGKWSDFTPQVRRRVGAGRRDYP